MMYRPRRLLYESSDPTYTVNPISSYRGKGGGQKIEIFYQEKRRKKQLLFRVVLSYWADDLYFEKIGGLMDNTNRRIPKKYHFMNSPFFKVRANGDLQDAVMDHIYIQYKKFFAKLNGIPFEESSGKIKSFTTRLFNKISKVKSVKALR